MGGGQNAGGSLLAGLQGKMSGREVSKSPPRAGFQGAWILCCRQWEATEGGTHHSRPFLTVVSITTDVSQPGNIDMAQGVGGSLSGPEAGERVRLYCTSLKPEISGLTCNSDLSTSCRKKRSGLFFRWGVDHRRGAGARRRLECIRGEPVPGP